MSISRRVNHFYLWQMKTAGTDTPQLLYWHRVLEDGEDEEKSMRVAFSGNNPQYEKFR
jgi:hypothetical protein